LAGAGAVVEVVVVFLWECFGDLVVVLAVVVVFVESAAGFPVAANITGTARAVKRAEANSFFIFIFSLYERFSLGYFQLNRLHLHSALNGSLPPLPRFVENHTVD
jgi:hypothetical protein